MKYYSNKKFAQYSDEEFMDMICNGPKNKISARALIMIKMFSAAATFGLIAFFWSMLGN